MAGFLDDLGGLLERVGGVAIGYENAKNGVNGNVTANNPENAQPLPDDTGGTFLQSPKAGLYLAGGAVLALLLLLLIKGLK